MTTIPKWLIIVFVVVALAGFVDASYLTAEHLRGTIPPCSVVSGCEEVLTSQYATVMGVPVAAGGMLYYAVILGLLIAYLDTGRPRIMSLACQLTVLGFFGSLYFVFIQAFVLHAYCLYCLGSALTSTLLFLIAIRIVRANRIGYQQ